MSARRPIAASLAKAYGDAEPATLKAKCPALTIASFDKPEIVEPVQFVKDARGWRAGAGAWVQRATLDACGTKVLRRILVETKSDNTLRTRALLPGEYAGGYKLEETARAYVVDSMMNVIACKDWKTAAVLDIALVSKPTAGRWRETWTALVCGKTVTARGGLCAERREHRREHQPDQGALTGIRGRETPRRGAPFRARPTRSGRRGSASARSSAASGERPAAPSGRDRSRK